MTWKEISFAWEKKVSGPDEVVITFYQGNWYINKDGFKVLERVPSVEGRASMGIACEILMTFIPKKAGKVNC